MERITSHLRDIIDYCLLNILKVKNVAVVKETIKISFGVCRNDILENGHTFNIIEKNIAFCRYLNM